MTDVTMRLSQRLISAAVLLAIAGALGGCGFGGNFDPTDVMDWFDTKKKLPGERKPVFPEGVPGVEQGVPKELYKGAQHQEDVPAVTEPAPEPQAKKPTRSAKAAKSAHPKAAPAAEPEASPEGEESGTAAASVSAPAKPKAKRRRATAPQPEAAPAQAQPQQAAPAAPQQASPPPFPAPLPSGSFSR